MKKKLVTLSKRVSVYWGKVKEENKECNMQAVDTYIKGYLSRNKKGN